ncbi:hypothetical protein EMCRGX_G012494 [Ephydatia muelleri]|eukprot:Em0004g63a
MTVPHVQASFFTKEARNVIPETPFSIPVSVSRDDLSAVINQVLEESGHKEFDFLINNHFLQSSLEKFITDQHTPTENVIHIEYVERNPPPTLNQEVRHNEWVSAVHCSAKLILTGSYDGVVRIWSREGKLLGTAEGHTAPVKDVAWLNPGATGDGQLFVSASQDQTIHMWKYDWLTADVVHLYQCRGHARSVEAVAPSPDQSKFSSVSWDKYVKIWSSDPSPGEEAGDDASVPVKKRKSTSKQPKVMTRTPLVTLAGHTQPAVTVRWPTEDELLTGGWDHCIRLWDMATGVNKSTLNGSKVFHDIDQSIALPHLITSANSDKLVRIWDKRINSGSAVQSFLVSHLGWVVSVCWSPVREHQLASGSYDGTVRMWDARSGKVPLYTIMSHEGKVLSLDWSCPEVIASGGTDNMLRTYSVS